VEYLCLIKSRDDLFAELEAAIINHASLGIAGDTGDADNAGQ